MRWTLAGLAIVSACGKVNAISDAPEAIADAQYLDAHVDAPLDAFVPYVSCKQLATLHPTMPSGVYQLDPDGSGPTAAFNAYCDMSMDGGGWTLAMTAAVTTNWTPMTPGYTQPTSPTDTTVNTTALHHSTIAAMGVTQMMIMGGDRIIKFHYPRPAVDFTSNYRELTERATFDSTHSAIDAPHTGGARGTCLHVNDACTTSDFAAFKTADVSCGHDATNSYPAWGDCPGNGTTPPSPTPNCWFYAGTSMAAVPTIASCPTTSQAPWGNYAVGTLTGMTTVWVR